MRAWALLLGAILALTLLPAASAGLILDPSGGLMHVPGSAVGMATDAGDPVLGPGESTVPCDFAYVGGTGDASHCPAKAPEEVAGALSNGEDAQAPVPAPEQQAAAPAKPAANETAAEPAKEPAKAEPVEGAWTSPSPPSQSADAEVPPQPPALAAPRGAEPRPTRLAAVPQEPQAGWPLAAASGVLLLPFLLKLLPVAALRRRAQPDPPAQRLVVALVQANPGIHHSELRRRAGLSNGTVEHYVHRLVKSGVLVVHRTAGNTCYVLPETAPAAAARHLALRNPVARRLLALLGEGGTLSLAEMGRRAGAPPSTVHYHVVRMERAGLLRSTASGRERLVSLGTAAAAAAVGLPAFGGQGTGSPAPLVGEPS